MDLKEKLQSVVAELGASESIDIISSEETHTIIMKEFEADYKRVYHRLISSVVGLVRDSKFEDKRRKAGEFLLASAILIGREFETCVLSQDPDSERIALCGVFEPEDIMQTLKELFETPPEEAIH